jgi:hypothetical protein
MFSHFLQLVPSQTFSHSSTRAVTITHLTQAIDHEPHLPCITAESRQKSQMPHGAL